ncbi:GH92 family glycosyl hydrolase [Streptomyces sp. NPDC005438]|uniref:GH92 family glycosyl hydrolase n=1 Tax=Streptomyces sp. NPDC005438 TaxID=3156880 RepID=UPI0033B29438
MSGTRLRRAARRLRAPAVTTVAVATALAVPATVFPAVAAPKEAPKVHDPARYVNTFTGTQDGGPDFGHGGGAGNTFPGAVAPFGMVQWSPDTVDHKHGGYEYDDNRIRGFSLTHLSGPGCSDFGNIPFLPVLGDEPVDSSTFSHDNESSAPGSYDVTFDNGLRSQLTATQRSGMARFTYPEGKRASLTVDAAKAFNEASGEIEIGSDSLSGYTDGGGFCGAGNKYRVYFHVTFDRDFSESGVVEDGAVNTSRKKITGSSDGVAATSPKTARAQRGADTRKAPTTQPKATGKAAEAGAQALVSFDTERDRSVEARVGISFVSLDNAKDNLKVEQGGRGFEQVRAGSRAQWNEKLGRISVGGGSATDRRRFYTALYHSLIHPNVLSDAGGEYRGFDGEVHRARPGHAQYANFSGWDVYRSQVQLVALIEPEVASDLAQSATNQAAQGGYFDRWTVANGGTGVMVGDPLPVIISGVHAFGARDFDAQRALELMVDGASNGDERPAHERYDELGYVPAGEEGVWGSASTTLEYTSADFAVSQFAERLGADTTHRDFLRRAQNWKNLFNEDSGYLQPRKADGSWPEFSPVQNEEYVEGNGEHYTWMVPYNHRALFDRMGGDAKVNSRLDDFFTELNGGPDKATAYLSNEPTASTPWAYAYAGAPYKTQDVVRRALTKLFKPTPDGLTGNDDLGQMSSWAVWASMGMYPELPGRSELVLASPVFEWVTIDRGHGRSITVRAEGASEQARYVKSLRVNGKASERPWLSEEFVARGGTVDFTLGTEADEKWGSAREDAPPSFDAAPPRK